MEKMSKTQEEIKTFPELAYLDPDTGKELKKILGFELYTLEETKELLRVDGYIHSAKKLYRSAWEWIQRLERDKAWASENYELIREENKRLEAHILCKIDVIKRLEDQNAELLEKIKQLERERDAAVADLATIHKCEPCKHRTSNSYISNECFDCVNFCNFE